MNSHIAGWLAATLCFLINQSALAEEALRFSPSAGGHGIDGCAFSELSGDANGIGWTQFGVAVDHATLELTGTVSRSQSALSPRAVTLEIGNDREILLSATFADRSEHLASGRFPGVQMENVLFSVAKEKEVWIRIDSGPGGIPEPRTMKVVANADEVTSCLAHLKREIAEERALRATGGASTRF